MGNSTQKKPKAKKPQLVAAMLNNGSKELLSRFSNHNHAKQPNHHVTLQYGCSVLTAAAFTGMEWRAPVLHVVTDHTAVVANVGEVEVLVVRFNEDHEGLWLPVRPALDACSKVLNKGRREQNFHVTISHTSEVKAVHSNEVLRLFDEADPSVIEVEGMSETGFTHIGGTVGWVDGGGGDHYSWERLKGFTPKLALAHCVGRSGVGSKPLPDLEEQLLADIHTMTLGFVVNGGRMDLSPEAMALTAPGIARNSDIPADATFADHDHRGELHRCVELSGDTLPTTRGGMVFIWGLGSILVDLDSTNESESSEEGVPSLVREAVESGAIYNVVSLQANPYPGTAPAPVGPHKHDRKVAAGEIPEDAEARQACVDFWDEGPEGHTLVCYK